MSASPTCCPSSETEPASTRSWPCHMPRWHTLAQQLLNATSRQQAAIATDELLLVMIPCGVLNLRQATLLIKHFNDGQSVAKNRYREQIVATVSKISDQVRMVDQTSAHIDVATLADLTTELTSFCKLNRPLLVDKKPSVRTLTAMLIGSCWSTSDGISFLFRRYVSEQDQEVKAVVLQALVRYVGRCPSQRGYQLGAMISALLDIANTETITAVTKEIYATHWRVKERIDLLKRIHLFT